MHVRKAEIVFWIDQGWLEVTKEGQGRTVAYLISPEALRHCLREYWQDLQKRNIRSSTILAVFSSATCQSTPSKNNVCRCARRSGSRPRTNQQPFSTAEIHDAERISGSEAANRRDDWLQRLHCTHARRPLRL
jgi:hypothetical protein